MSIIGPIQSGQDQGGCHVIAPHCVTPSALEIARSLQRGDFLRNLGYALAQITPRPVVHSGETRVVQVQLCFQLVPHGLKAVKMSKQAHHVLTSEAQNSLDLRIRAEQALLSIKLVDKSNRRLSVTAIAEIRDCRSLRRWKNPTGKHALPALSACSVTWVLALDANRQRAGILSTHRRCRKGKQVCVE